MIKHGVIILSIFSLIYVTCNSGEPLKTSMSGTQDFTLTSLDGETITLSYLKGKVILVDFWATWCPPCRNSIPHLTSLYEKYKDQGLVVLGISTEDQQTLLNFRNSFHVTYPLLLGTKDVAQAYDVQAIPKTIFIDKKGKIRKTQIGFAPELADMFDAFIDTLLNE
jgi:cytochrome c biogenesis protein CcmG/thiol:disulfide interchange protein DsbE